MSLSFVISAVFKKLNLPRVVAQIACGMILGIPLLKDAVFDAESLNSLKVLADIGIILLFFFIGLETNISVFARNIKKDVLISVFNTGIPLVLGYATMHYLFGLDSVQSIVVGVSLGVSSQAISLDFLEELNMIRSKIGQLIISAGAVDDVVELTIVSAVIIAITATTGNLGFVQLLIRMAYFIFFLVLMRNFIIPVVLRFTDEKSKPILFMSSLIIVILTAGVAEWLGIESLIGALFAGILLRQTLLVSERRPWEEHQIAQAIHTVSFGFMVPLFFIWVGLNTNVASLASNIPLTATVIATAFVGTIVGTIIGVKLSGGTIKEGNIIGWGVNAKGDTELVIASLALSRGIISTPIFSSLIIMAISTTIVSPIVFRRLMGNFKNKRKEKTL